MIKAALFDYGGVLSRAGQARSVERLLGSYWGVEPDKIDIADLEANFQRGAITPEDFFEGLSVAYPDNKPIDEETFLEIDIGLYNPVPEVYQLAQKLRDRGIATGIISNVFPIFAEKIRKFGGYNNFHPVILSYEEGVIKPQPEIYESAISKLNMRPNEIVFIDDQEECLIPATNLGMMVIKAISPEQIAQDIKGIIQRENASQL